MEKDVPDIPGLATGVDLPIIRVSNVPYPERDKKRVFLRAIESLRGF